MTCNEEFFVSNVSSLADSLHDVIALRVDKLDKQEVSQKDIHKIIISTLIILLGNGIKNCKQELLLYQRVQEGLAQVIFNDCRE